MSEHFPGDTGGPEKRKKVTKGGSRFEMPTTTPRTEIQRSAGYETLKFGEGLKPLGEAYKPEIAPSKPDIEFDSTLSKIEKDVKERQQDRYREISAEELRARAAHDAAEQLAHHHQALFEEEHEKSVEDDGTDDDDEPVVKAEKPTAEEAAVSQQERDEFTKIMQQNAPELEAEASAEELGDDALNQAVAEAEANRYQRPETSIPLAGAAGAAEVAAAEHTAEAPQVSVDEKSKPEAFNEWIQNEHPELNTPEMAAASDPDQEFNDIVTHSLGGDAPGETRYFEQAPGEPPVDMDAGQNQPPNYPPTAEGGAWGDSGDDPNQNRAFNRNYPPNPNILNNPWTPAGGLTNPNTWAAIGALQARNEINNLKHTAREIGLAGAVGLLGLGLIADHLWARRRFKKQKRQIKELGKQQDKTSEALRQEQADHMLTKHKLERVSAERSAGAEKTGGQLHQHHAAGAEQGIAAGFAAALIPRAEAPTLKPVQQVEQAPALQPAEMARSREDYSDAGQSKEHGPDLHNAEYAELAIASGAEAAKAGENHVFNQEGTHEQLQNQYLDSAGVKKSSSAGTDGGSAPISPISSQDYTSDYHQNAGPYDGQFQDQDKYESSYAKPAVAGVIVFVIVLIALFIFAR